MRTAAEIEAEIEAKKAAGVHHASKEMRDLRDELKAVTAPPVVTSVNDGTFDMSDDPPNPLGSEEWRFLEKACAEVKLRDDGNQSNIYKKFYQSIKAKLLIWRICRAQMLKNGPGADWPEWTDLGLNPSTGRPMEKKADPVRLVPQVVKEPEAADDVSNYAASVRAQMGAMMAPRGGEAATA